MQAAAGDRLRIGLSRLTVNRFAGVATGAFPTAVIQSSSETTVRVASFIRSGVMSLSRSVGVILGASRLVVVESSRSISYVVESSRSISYVVESSRSISYVVESDMIEGLRLVSDFMRRVAKSVVKMNPESKSA